MVEERASRSSAATSEEEEGEGLVEEVDEEASAFSSSVSFFSFSLLLQKDPEARENSAAPTKSCKERGRVIERE